MEKSSSSIASKVGIAATVVSLVGGTVALWDQFKPGDEHPDLSGRWTISNTVTGSNGGKFDGEVYVYSVGVMQDKNQGLKGNGEQTLYNGKVAASRFPIQITDGNLTEEGIKAHFTIQGNREFTGTLWLTMVQDDPKHWTGTFEYTAGGTLGSTEVRIK
ncbi:MAG TPA: hypothetical protein PLR96_01605 [Flavobacteriales bacterium]|jgi:hypothetical protein|nr:hypothetical protein [Flavobacteriales bacterium]